MNLAQRVERRQQSKDLKGAGTALLMRISRAVEGAELDLESQGDAEKQSLDAQRYL